MYCAKPLPDDLREEARTDFQRAAEGGEAPLAALPCLYSDNSDKADLPERLKEAINSSRLTPYHKKQAYVLYMEVERMCKTYGVDRVGFMTLTVPNDKDGKCPNEKEIMRRFNNLNRRVFERYVEAIRVIEWGTVGGRPHLHLLVVMPFDIRSGVQWKETKAGYKPVIETIGKDLREEWAYLRKTLPRYGFGRHELLPVRTSQEACSRYVGGYVKKGVLRRPDGCKVRLFACIKVETRAASTCFAWASPNSRKWRNGVRILAQAFDLKYEDLRSKFGPRWAYLWKEHIFRLARQHEEGYDFRNPPRIPHPRNGLARKSFPPSG